VFIVIDAIEIGSLPVTPIYNDLFINTVEKIAKSVPEFKLPNLAQLG